MLSALSSSTFRIRPSGLFPIRIIVAPRIFIDGRNPWTGGQPCHKATTYTGQHKQKKRGQTSMPRVGYESTIPVVERAIAFHALDRAATAIVIIKLNLQNYFLFCFFILAFSLLY
jgi:hypothetical protein